MAKSWSGFSTAAAWSAGPHRNPTPMTRSLPASTRPGEALGAVALAGRGGLAAGGAQLLDGLVEARGGGVVEGAVAAAGDVEQEPDARTLDGRCG